MKTKILVLLVIFVMVLAGIGSAESLKGAAIGKENIDQKDVFLKKVNASWYYTWSLNPIENAPANVEFVPMVWGKKAAETLKGMIDRKEFKYKYLLTFNEPDGKKQANMSVEEALSYWPAFMKLTGVKLGSPACVDPENAWMEEFMKTAEKRGYRVDFITMHWYGKSADALFKKLDRVWKKYKRPIWLTEFAIVDWRGILPNKAVYSANRTFLTEQLGHLKSLPYLERYAWFSGKLADERFEPSRLQDKDKVINELGELYSR